MFDTIFRFYNVCRIKCPIESEKESESEKCCFLLKTRLIEF